MPQRINMMLTMSKPTNRSSSIPSLNQSTVPINTNINMNGVNVSRFNMNSIFGARGRPCG